MAFYDFIGIDHRPARPAEAPLTFILAEGSSEALIPARTRIASVIDPSVIFETLEDLTAVNTVIKALYSHNPWFDKYTDHNGQAAVGGEGYFIFGGDAEEKTMDHVLYVADDLFDFTGPLDVTITFGFSNSPNDFKNLFSHCSDGAGKELLTQGEFPIVKLKNLAIPKTIVNKKEARWISFRPDGELPQTEEGLPIIAGITCFVIAQMAPDALLYNDITIDQKKGFYPFGQLPKVGDCLYIGCREAFAKEGATITLNTNLTGGTGDGNPAVIWEYWESTKWVILEVTDNTNNFTSTSQGAVTITFKCPAIKAIDLNGIPSRWIRARINTGGYGELPQYREVTLVKDIINNLQSITDTNQKTSVINELNGENIKLGMEYVSSTLKPPFISSLSIQCSSDPEPIKYCQTYNNFSYEAIEMISPTNTLKPFRVLRDADPAFYVGFGEDYPRDRAITLLSSFKSPYSYEAVTRLRRPGYSGDSMYEKVQGHTWEYYSISGEWKSFGPEDGTDLFSKSGIIRFIFPSDIGKKGEFGKELYWIRARAKKGSWLDPPRLNGVFPNTVWAENATVIKDELLGTSNGQPNQLFTFSSRPVLDGETVEIREPSIPSAEEIEATKSEGAEPVRVVKNAAGDVQEVWVRWQKVSTFVHSGPTSRHYVINRVDGSIIFGDGIQGMIPPALTNNILAREYKSGGGKKGNQKKEAITGLKTTIPNIKGVVNYEAAAGGADLETIDGILTSAPHAIKNSGRAVTSEDFEWLAREASPQVAKAKCIKINDGTIQVVIAPDYDDGSLYPEAGLMDYVETYLKDRAFVSILNSLQVSGAEYVGVTIETVIVPLSLSEGPVVADRVEKRLRSFLDPIRGGDEQKGWNFGDGLFFSAVAAEIENTQGVDYVISLLINDRDISEASFIAIEEHQLLKPETITVHLSGGGA